MNRKGYRFLCVSGVIATVGVIFTVTIPIQDYALREHQEWHSHPSSEPLTVFQEKQREESQLPLFTAKFRPKPGKSN